MPEQLFVVAERGELGLRARGALAGPRGMPEPADRDAEAERDEESEAGDGFHAEIVHEGTDMPPAVGKRCTSMGLSVG